MGSRMPSGRRSVQGPPYLQVSAVGPRSTVNDPGDFGIGKRLRNLPTLRAAGFTATRRLLDVQKISRDPADGQDIIARICQPVTTGSGPGVAGLRLSGPAPALCSPPCASSSGDTRPAH
jgi:hypothetical protein